MSHDSSEIILKCWFCAEEIFLLIMNHENSCAAQYFCENQDTVFFQDTLVNIKFKRTAFIWNIIFCNIIYCHYNQFNPSLWNKKEKLITEMQTGKGEKRWEHCVDQGHAPHGIYFKDFCFTCSFVVTLRFFLLFFLNIKLAATFYILKKI